MRTRHTTLAIGLSLALTAAGLATAALSADAKATIETRQANMKKFGAAMKGVNDELKKDAPDLSVVKTNAAAVQDLAAKEPSWFPAGTGAETGIKTAAKAEIWTDQPGFTAAAKKLETEAAKLEQLASAGDAAGAKDQTRAIAGACKGCHDKFRAPPEQH
jgi:cytochrome c556